jgi:predicted amidophosphoribosyltransferase
MVIASLATLYLVTQQANVEKLLGGSITAIVPVPSTRGRPFDKHPLAQALRRSVQFRDRIVDGMAHVLGGAIGRREYKPTIFVASSEALRDQRVVLIEDLWVSGAKAMSAAGAALTAGAASVLILPLARELRPSFCGEDHPYLVAMGTPYSVKSWPR